MNAIFFQQIIRPMPYSIFHHNFPSHGTTNEFVFYIVQRVATVIEKSWVFWNFEIFWNFWKSYGILTKNGQGHGKVMEFLNLSKKSWKNHGILQKILGHDSHESAPLCGHWKVMEKSWNFVGTISWQPWYNKTLHNYNDEDPEEKSCNINHMTNSLFRLMKMKMMMMMYVMRTRRVLRTPATVRVKHPVSPGSSLVKSVHRSSPMMDTWWDTWSTTNLTHPGRSSATRVRIMCRIHPVWRGTRDIIRRRTVQMTQSPRRIPRLQKLLLQHPVWKLWQHLEMKQKGIVCRVC